LFEDFKSIRWFLLPSEAFDLFVRYHFEGNTNSIVKMKPPFVPIKQFGTFSNTFNYYTRRNYTQPQCYNCINSHVVDELKKLNSNQQHQNNYLEFV
jgi:hypothetical protein